jgi:hypothetical protein
MNRFTSLALASLALFLASTGASWSGGTPGGTQPEASPVPESSLTPEERMNRRWPQKVRVGDLIGLPILDNDDRTLGHVTQVVRTAAGKIELIVACCGYVDWNRHPVPVPIETVAILARQIDVLDIPRQDFLALATWDGTDHPIDPNETIRIAISRR